MGGIFGMTGPIFVCIGSIGDFAVWEVCELLLLGRTQSVLFRYRFQYFSANKCWLHPLDWCRKKIM